MQKSSLRSWSRAEATWDSERQRERPSVLDEGAYGYNPGYHRGIYIGSVNDGVVRAFIADPNPSGGTSFLEGISVAEDGTIWGASVGNRTTWKWVRD